MDLVRQSCSDFVAQTKGCSNARATLCLPNIQALARNLDLAAIKEAGSSLAFSQVDIDFKGNTKAHAGFLFLFHAIDFGGGFRLELHKFHGKGAFNTIKQGIHNLVSSSPECPEISPIFLRSLDHDRIKQLFGLSGATQADGLEQFIVGLHTVCQEIGQQVTALKHDTLGDYIFHQIGNTQGAGAEHRAQRLVTLLVEHFPSTFNDVYDWSVDEGKVLNCSPQLDSSKPNSEQNRIYFYKKAQLVVGELYHGLKDQMSLFAFDDGEALTCYVDNVICAVCRKLELVKLSPGFEQAIESGENIRRGSVEEVSFRACSLVALERLTELANRAQNPDPTQDKHLSKEVGSSVRLGPNELGNYFWGVLGKTAAFRQFTRHVTKDTIFY